MAKCKNCQEELEWAFDSDMQKWVPLQPLGQDADLEKRFVDKNGNLRADHRSKCLGNGNVLTVTRLRQPQPAEVHSDSISTHR